MPNKDSGNREAELGKNLASAKTILAEQRHLSQTLLKRWEAAIIAVESLERKQPKNWQERRREVIHKLARISTWIQVFLWLTVLVGFLSSIYSLSPKVTVSVGERLMEKDALSAQVVIANDGVLPIYDVKLYCMHGDVYYNNGGELHIKDEGSLHTQSDETSRIESGQKFTTVSFCRTPYSDRVPVSFDVVLRVTFKPPLGSHTYREFRIVSTKAPDGKILTIQNPVPKKNR